MTKILIAEDEPDIRELVSITLKFAGFEVEATNNGQELLARVPEVKPDLILMDVRMPRVTGYEACKTLKDDPALSHIPVVFLSAKGQEEEVRLGMQAGAEAYIIKPFAPDELVLRVKDILSRVPARPPAQAAKAEPAPAAGVQPPAAPAAATPSAATPAQTTPAGAPPAAPRPAPPPPAAPAPSAPAAAPPPPPMPARTKPFGAPPAVPRQAPPPPSTPTPPPPANPAPPPASPPGSAGGDPKAEPPKPTPSG